MDPAAVWSHTARPYDDYRGLGEYYRQTLPVPGHEGAVTGVTNPWSAPPSSLAAQASAGLTETERHEDTVSSI